MDHYPQAFEIASHPYASEVPNEYEDWPKVGIVREPVGRLWSLYNFLNGLTQSFEEWLLSEEYARTSQWHYLRPDLGTTIYQFTNQKPLYDRLGLEIPSEDRWLNHNLHDDVPELSAIGTEHINTHLSWDIEQTKE